MHLVVLGALNGSTYTKSVYDYEKYINNASNIKFKGS